MMQAKTAEKTNQGAFPDPPNVQDNPPVPVSEVQQEKEPPKEKLGAFGLDVKELDAIEGLIEQQDRIMRILLKLTSRADWTAWPVKDTNHQTICLRWEMGRKGAMKIARAFGIRIEWEAGDGKRIDEEGGHFSFHYRAMFTFKNRTIPGEGSYSSRDKLLGDSKPELVDATKIRKAALSNCLKHGITDLLGLGNFAPHIIEEYFKSMEWTIPEMKFTKGAKGGDSRGFDDKELQQKIGKMVLEMCNGDKEGARALLEKLTFWKSPDGKKTSPGIKGWDELQNVTGKKLYAIYKTIETEYKKTVPPEEGTG